MPQFDYTDVDLGATPERKKELTAASPEDTTVPKLVVDGVAYTLDTIQEMNEEGEVAALLVGEDV